MTLAAPTDLLVLGLRFAALGLLFGSVVLLLTGTAHAVGSSLRLGLEPVLRLVRDQTSLSRSDLADGTIVAAMALAACSAVVDRQMLAPLMVVGLWLARPSVRRATRQENRMLAIAGYFSLDLMIGVYTPVMMAQFLTGHVLLGGCLLAVVVALSWPAGGGSSSIPGRRWQLAAVTAS